MKKLLIGASALVILIIITLVSYNIVQANNPVPEKTSLISIQKEIDKKISTYGYTFDNPNIILNPYEISPLTALIAFETKSPEIITITIKQ